MPAISTVQITDVAPRGAAAGAAIVITGLGFGGTQGQVRFAPTTLNLLAVITGWTSTSISCVVPAGLPTNAFTELQVINQPGDNFDIAPFWIPALPPPASNDGLKHQWPAFEAGPTENDDDPRRFSAADFNRALDRINAGSTPAPPVPPQYLSVADVAARDAIPAPNRSLGMLVFTVAEDTFWQLKGGLLNTNWIAVTLGGGDTIQVDTYITTNGMFIFPLSLPPLDTSKVVLRINSIDYTVVDGQITVGGPGNQTVTWLNGFPISTSDRATTRYPV